MLGTLSERRLSELIRNLEGINDTDEEIAFRMQHYAAKLFKHVYDGYGLRMVGMIEHSGGIGTFRFDISGVGRDWQTSDFSWEKLIGGLQFMNALAVTVELQDIQQICTGLIATTATDQFPKYQHELQRLAPSQLQSGIESVLQRYVWNKPVETTAESKFDRQLKSLGNSELDAQFQDSVITAQFERAGVRDPLAKHKEIEAFRRAEEEEFAKQEAARRQAAYEEFTRH